MFLGYTVASVQYLQFVLHVMLFCQHNMFIVVVVAVIIIIIVVVVVVVVVVNVMDKVR